MKSQIQAFNEDLKQTYEDEEQLKTYLQQQKLGRKGLVEIVRYQLEAPKTTRDKISIQFCKIKYEISKLKDKSV